MESPVKKLDFGAANKENEPLNQTIDTTELKTKIVEETKKEETKTAVAPGIKAEEADEPLLQENPQRFVLFPIKYHEVSDAF
jgi:ribonucleoside-diphosphate reductase subunit M2